MAPRVRMAKKYIWRPKMPLNSNWAHPLLLIPERGRHDFTKLYSDLCQGVTTTYNALGFTMWVPHAKKLILPPIGSNFTNLWRSTVTYAEVSQYPTTFTFTKLRPIISSNLNRGRHESQGKSIWQRNSQSLEDAISG